MSARAYLSSGPDKDDQVERAKSVLDRMLTKGGGPDRYAFIGQGFGGTNPIGAEIGDSQNPPFNAEDRSLSWLQGVRYTFRSKLFILPMGRANAASSANILTLTRKAGSVASRLSRSASRLWETTGNSTMGADRKTPLHARARLLAAQAAVGGRASRNSGQAMVEFLLLLPAVVILIAVLVRVNLAIQVSIVNQQYARAQALWLAFNSPVYPELRHRVKNFQSGTKLFNEMVIGVSQNAFPDEGDEAYQPEATIQNVSQRKTGETTIPR